MQSSDERSGSPVADSLLKSGTALGAVIGLVHQNYCTCQVIFVQESEQKCFCGWGFARILGGQLTALPRLPSWIKGLTSKGMGNLLLYKGDVERAEE